MKELTIDALWSTWMDGAKALLEEHCETLNLMNVFPVADADTGSNMVHTIQGLSSLAPTQGVQTGLENSRGNSGTLLAIWLQKFVTFIEPHSSWTPEALSSAFKNAWTAAKSSMSHPEDGTMLTVMESLSTVRLFDEISPYLESILNAAVDSAYSSSEELSQVRSARTFDAGAVGFVLIVEGLVQASGITHSVLPQVEEMLTAIPHKRDASTSHSATSGEEIVCVIDLSLPHMAELRSSLEVAGDSLVIAPVEDGTSETPRWKIHIHTQDTARILQLMDTYATPQHVNITSLSGEHA